jgi:hypothetical protein
MRLRNNPQCLEPINDGWAYVAREKQLCHMRAVAGYRVTPSAIRPTNHGAFGQSNPFSLWIQRPPASYPFTLIGTASLPETG